MGNAVQLSLFSGLVENQDMNIEDITIVWLLKFLDTQYPEMKFQICKYFADGSFAIVQKISKKIDCHFHIGKYNLKLPQKNHKFIGYSYGKEYGDYYHSAGPIDSIEEFKAKLPIIIQTVKDYIKN